VVPADPPLWIQIRPADPLLRPRSDSYRAPVHAKSSTQPIRILIACSRRERVSQVIREIQRQPDMQIIGQVADAIETLITVRESRVDLVVLALEGDEIPGLSSHLLSEFPGLTVLGLGAGEHLDVLEQLCPWRQRIERGEAENLVRRLRRAVRQPCSPCLEAAPVSPAGIRGTGRPVANGGRPGGDEGGCA